MRMAVFGKSSFFQRRFYQARRTGFGLIEVIIAIGMAAVIIASVGNTLAANDRLSTSSLAKEQALNYARQGIEVVQSIAQSTFGCTPLTAGICPAGYSCVPLTGYTSCWTSYPDNPATVGVIETGPFHLALVAGKWQLQANTETIGSSNEFTRSITINNLPDPAGLTYYNIKKVIVDVSWLDHGQPKNTTLTTIVTGWKNI